MHRIFLPRKQQIDEKSSYDFQESMTRAAIPYPGLYVRPEFLSSKL